MQVYPDTNTVLLAVTAGARQSHRPNRPYQTPRELSQRQNHTKANAMIGNTIIKRLSKSTGTKPITSILIVFNTREYLNAKQYVQGAKGMLQQVL